MVSVHPIQRALVPVDTEAAARISAPNYDEFQGDREVFEAIHARPDCVLRVTMAHCAVSSPDEILAQDSSDALDRAFANFEALRESPYTRTVEDVLFVYEIVDPRRPDVRQIGLGGMAETGAIRDEENPDGTLVRNEGIREKKARGRARLVERTGAFVGTVNLAVEDPEGSLHRALELHADSHGESFRAFDERKCVHRVWLVDDPEEIRSLQSVLAGEPRAYVADGNHRSAAAAMLGLPGFLAVFFCARTMGLAPYNRLVKGPRLPLDEVLSLLSQSFEARELTGVEAFQPNTTHEIGLYADGRWIRLTPREGTFDPDHAVQAVDAHIVQRHFFDEILGITDPRDERLTFVGGDRDVGYLVDRVDSGEFAYAVALPPVTMTQFVDVCRQGRFMPPKSTWFQPKLRMGLVAALLDPAAPA